MLIGRDGGLGEGISFGEVVQGGDCEEEGTCFWDGAE